MFNITLRLKDKRETTVAVSVLPRIGETIITEGECFKIDEIIYNFDREGTEVYVLTSPRPELTEIFSSKE